MFVRIDSQSKIDNKLFDMCESAHQSKDPTAKNIERRGWINRPETLLHQIFKQKVYDEGGYFAYEEGSRYLGGMGFYPFEEDKNIFVCPVRLYVTPDLSLKKSMRIIQQLVAHTVNYAKDNYRAMIFFVNEHNKWRLKSMPHTVNPKKNPYAVFPNLETKQYDKTVSYKFTDQTAVYLDYSDYEKEILKCLKKITI